MPDLKVSNANGFGLELRGMAAYWTNKIEGGSVWGSTIEVANTEKALAVNQVYPTYVTADAANVYWAINGNETCEGSEGAVRMKPFAMLDENLPGYNLVTNIPCPSNFVRGAGKSDIYWGAGKKIYRMVNVSP